MRCAVARSIAEGSATLRRSGELGRKTATAWIGACELGARLSGGDAKEEEQRNRLAGDDGKKR